MSSVSYTDLFSEQVSSIRSRRLLNELDRRLDAIESYPHIGSQVVRASLIRSYGTGIRKFPVPPFIIIYRYEEAQDRLEFIALPHERGIA